VIVRVVAMMTMQW